MGNPLIALIPRRSVVAAAAKPKLTEPHWVQILVIDDGTNFSILSFTGALELSDVGAHMPTLEKFY